ncbi:MAG: hypothetical protein ACTH8J_15970, partial [Specibacter sp.]
MRSRRRRERAVLLCRLALGLPTLLWLALLALTLLTRELSVLELLVLELLLLLARELLPLV